MAAVMTGGDIGQKDDVASDGARWAKMLGNDNVFA